MEQSTNFNLATMFESATFIQPNALFYHYFGVVPSKKMFLNIDQPKLLKKVQEQYQTNAAQVHKSCLIDSKEKLLS
jgi:hypothetical protein